MGVRFLERLQLIIKSELFDPVENASDHFRPPSIDQLREDLKHELGRLIAEQYTLSKSASQASLEIEGLESKAQRAVELGRDDLAKAALTEKSYLTSEQAQIGSRLDRLDQSIAAIENVLKSLSASNTPPANLKAQLEELNTLLSNDTANTGDRT